MQRERLIRRCGDSGAKETFAAFVEDKRFHILGKRTPRRKRSSLLDCTRFRA
jgi:hypothetical protein